MSSFDDNVESISAAIDAKDERIAVLESAIVELLPRMPEANPKDGPCCYELEEVDGLMLWIGQGCTCGNYDDAQSAAYWAQQTNRAITAQAMLKRLGLNYLAER